ncbi:MAG: NTP transferase domain-containing protein [Candidatus Woesearchaeota archaeon]
MKAIILAAGKSTRFKSDKPKVIHKVAGKLVVQHLIDLAKAEGIKEIVVVLGYKGEEVKNTLSGQILNFAWQKEQLGTGHAVMAANEFIDEDDILILYGDVPAIKKETLQELIKTHLQGGNIVTILTADLSDPKWYGRIIRKNNKVIGIKEMKDCSPEELMIKEINSGIYIVKGDFLKKALFELKDNNAQKEYYLTDIVGIAASENQKVGTFIIHDENEIKGINSLEELEEMKKIMQGHN